MDLSQYYEAICKEPMLSKQEEKRLILIYKNPSTSEVDRGKTKDKVIKSNLRFVFKQAKYYSKNDPTTFEELISAGNEGLLVGLEKYRPAEGKEFLTYAGWWVKQRILKAMSQMRIVSLPIWKQQLSAKIAKVKEADPSITQEELQLLFPDVSKRDLKELFDTRYLTYYLDDLEEEGSEIDSIALHLEREADTKLLHDAVSTLPHPFREIITYSFGLEDGKEMKAVQICRRLILTRDQLKELKKEALGLLQERLSAE